MTNRDERHHVEPDSYRMNLHCNNYDYDKKSGTLLRQRNCPGAHMGVIVPPSYSNQEWICDHYNLHFSHNNKFYVLRATPSTPFIKFYNNKWNLVFFKKAKFTELLVDYQQPPIIRVPFVPLSTNNDMHEHAIWLFNKLRNLIIFS